MGFLFVVDPTDDEDTTEILKATSGYPSAVIPVKEPERDDERVWNPSRYQHMVFLRNRLLEFTRSAGPRWFLSLDSDVLIHEAAIYNLMETMEKEKWDAVGGRTYMTRLGRDTRWPSCGVFTSQGQMRRPDSGGVNPVDVIMAIKLMSPMAYNVDYQYHKLGEDIGWSLAVKEAGGKIGWDGRVVSKHVMSPEHLAVVDPRVGF